MDPATVPSRRSASIRSVMTALTSPTIGTSALRFLPISAGSMSAWMTLASGANESSLPVTRSSNRVPSAISRSLRCSAATAATVPCMPGMPRFCGWLSGKAPRAIRVVTTGMPVSSARSISSLGGLAADDTAADVEHRLAGRGDELGGLADLAVVRLGVRLVAGQLDLRRPAERALALQHVLGDVDEHRRRDVRSGRCGRPRPSPAGCRRRCAPGSCAW